MDAPDLVDPVQPLLPGYAIRLPFAMARRVEDGSLVFWHTPAGLTFWISAQEGDGAADPVEGWREARSDRATDERVERDGALVRYGYRLGEEAEDEREPAFYGFVADGGTEFLVAAYFDAPELFPAVLATWRSIGPRSGTS